MKRHKQQHKLISWTTPIQKNVEGSHKKHGFFYDEAKTIRVNSVNLTPPPITHICQFQYTAALSGPVNGKSNTKKGQNGPKFCAFYAKKYTVRKCTINTALARSLFQKWPMFGWNSQNFEKKLSASARLSSRIISVKSCVRYPR